MRVLTIMVSSKYKFVTVMFLSIIFLLSFSLYNYVRIKLPLEYSNSPELYFSIIPLLLLFVPICISRTAGKVVDRYNPILIVNIGLVFFISLLLTLSDLTFTFASLLQCITVSIFAVMVNVGFVKKAQGIVGIDGIIYLALAVSLSGFFSPFIIILQNEFSLSTTNTIVTMMAVILLLNLIYSIFIDNNQVSSINQVGRKSTINNINKDRLSLLYKLNVYSAGGMFIVISFFFMFIPSLAIENTNLQHTTILLSLYGIGVTFVRFVETLIRKEILTYVRFVNYGLVCIIISLILFYLSCFYDAAGEYFFGLACMTLGFGSGLVLPNSIAINQIISDNAASGEEFGRYNSRTKLYELLGTSLIILLGTIFGSWISVFVLMISGFFVLTIFQLVNIYHIRNSIHSELPS